MVRIGGILALVVVAVTACSTETELTVQVNGQNAAGEVVPLRAVRIDVIPYDIDELYAELEQITQPGPAPSADQVNVLDERNRASCAAAAATSDAIAEVNERASATTDRLSPEYKQIFAEYTTLVERERSQNEECRQATNAYTSAREAYTEARREWQTAAWPDTEFDAAESLRVGDLPMQRIDTDENGTATVTVPNGSWWLLADMPVPGSASQKYRWNIRVEAEGGPQTVELSSDNATLEPF